MPRVRRQPPEVCRVLKRHLDTLRALSFETKTLTKDVFSEKTPHGDRDVNAISVVRCVYRAKERALTSPYIASDAACRMDG